MDLVIKSMTLFYFYMRRMSSGLTRIKVANTLINRRINIFDIFAV